MKGILKRNEFYLFLVIVAFGAAITIINPAFLTVENMFDLIRSSAGTAILAIGFFVILLSGGIDLSFPAVAIVAQYISVNAVIALGIDNLWLAFAIASVIGIAFGAVNAFFISFFKIPTMIVTLATMNIFHGLMLEFVGTKAINAGELPNCFKQFGLADLFTLTRHDGTTYGLSVFFAILVGVILVTWGDPALYHHGPFHLRHGRQHGGGAQVRLQHPPHAVLHLLLRGAAGLHHGHHPRVAHPLQQRHLHHRHGADAHHRGGRARRGEHPRRDRDASRAPSSV